MMKPEDGETSTFSFYPLNKLSPTSYLFSVVPITSPRGTPGEWVPTVRIHQFSCFSIMSHCLLCRTPSTPDPTLSLLALASDFPSTLLVHGHVEDTSSRLTVTTALKSCSWYLSFCFFTAVVAHVSYRKLGWLQRGRMWSRINSIPGGVNTCRTSHRCSTLHT